MSVEAGNEKQVLFGELQLPFNHSYLRGEIFPPFVTEQKLSENNTLELRDDDIFVATFPKSGTTWTQKILHSLHEVHNTDKFKEFSGSRFQQIAPWIEEVPKPSIDEAKSPRYFKTHTSYRNVKHDVSKSLKYIYIARNPKDTCVSLYYHCKGIKGFQYDGEFKEFGELFLKGQVESSDWWLHVREYYVNDRNMNVLFMKYEDLKKNPDIGVKQINDFCSLPKLSEFQTEEVVKATTFQSMKSNSSWTESNERRKEGATAFLRKGEIGDWKNHFSSELSKRFDDKTRELFSGLDLEFQYE